jgi:hypothetical protein
MQYIIKNISVPVSENPNFEYLIKKKFGLKVDNVNYNAKESIKVLKRAIDARSRNRLQFVYTLLLTTEKKLTKFPDIVPIIDENSVQTENQVKKLSDRHPFIIGMGPAGLFAALKLVEKGFQPYLFDQGDSIVDRQDKVNLFWKERKLDPLSNVQFGEGGAGAFSDGKLTSRTRNVYTEQVFEYLIKFGADLDILIDALPHIGTDRLVEIIKKIKDYLVEKGCKFFYNSKLTDIEIKNDKVVTVNIDNAKYSPEIVILAIGNSASDIFTLLMDRQVSIENKPFAVGLRIEHSLDYINNTFYGEMNDFSVTGPATYKLLAKHKTRSIYSFCMCPGGFVIPAHSETDGQVVNGMSLFKRNNGFSNSALVVSVNSNDFGSNVLDGMLFQRRLEKELFDNFNAPAQNVYDFMKCCDSRLIKKNSYFFDTKSINFRQLLPSFICDSLSTALLDFDRRYAGFIENGLFLGIETRTSSPVRILRDDNHLHSISVKNLYPIGEGAGYSGGIISSATDGLRTGQISEM